MKIIIKFPERLAVLLRVCLLLWFLTGISMAVSEKSVFEQNSPLVVKEYLTDGHGARLDFDERQYLFLKDKDTVVLRNFILESGLTVDLELEQFWIFNEATKFVYRTASGDSFLTPPEVILFRGKIRDIGDSRVYLSFSSDGCNGIIHIGHQVYFIATNISDTEESDEQEIYVCDRKYIPEPDRSPFICGTEQLESEDTHMPSDPDRLKNLDSEGNNYFVEIAVECTYSYLVYMGNLNNALIYMSQLLGAAHEICQRDLNIYLAASYILFNGSPDEYTADNIPELFDVFCAKWDATMGHIYRHYACLFTGPVSGSTKGLGARNGLCSSTNIYSAVAIEEGTFPWPSTTGLNCQDLVVTLHEWGHVFGSGHTHCYDPPIDQCWNCQGCIDLETCQDENSSCQDCTCSGPCYHGTINCGQGTLMSYCHNCDGGLNNINLEYHSRVQTQIITNLASRACVEEIITPATFVDWSNTGDEDGSYGDPWNTVMEGITTVGPGKSVVIKTGTYPEIINITQPCRLNVWQGGPVIIGE